MFRTTFVAVTGSMGKTTATSCLFAIFSACYHTNANRWDNSRGGLATTILRTRPRHRFTVIEVGTKLPGALRRAAWTIAPDTAAVLAVAAVHSNNFPTLDDVAREKSQLLSRLGRRGVAILNGDDPHVAAMAAGCRGRVVTFGRSPEFDVWASDVSSVWPARLSFRVHRGAESCQVNTKLVGEQWLNSVLAALAAALWHGVDLESATAALAQVKPMPGRMEPMPLPSGAVALRDDSSTSFVGLPAALRVLEQAQVRGRRILVATRAYDTGCTLRQSFRRLGEMGARSLDLAIIFAGNDHRRALNAMVEGGMKRESIRSFEDLWDAAECLKSEAREGDLVLFRDCNPAHGQRIYFAQLGSVGCRRPACARLLCDTCPELQPGLEMAPQMPAPTRPFWLAGQRAGVPRSWRV